MTGLGFLLATTVLGTATAHAADAVTAVAAPDASATALGEVIVTARKTRERLEDVPIPITALKGADLRANGHIRIEDLNQLTPDTNIVITNGHQAAITIRGLGNNPGNDGLEGSGGVFLDGVYLGRPGMAAMDLIDIDQIEVLRGPQGTLFGKNTTAGAVNITTQAPSYTLGGAVQATYGNYNYQQYQGTVTGPLVSDVLAGRLTAYSTTRDGWVDDVTTGQKVENLDRWGARGQLLYKPTADFSLRVIGEYEREQQSTGAVIQFNNFGATPAALTKLFGVVGVKVTADPSGATAYDNGPLQTGTRQGAASAEANWTHDGFILTSLTAWRNFNYNSSSDTDGTAADVINAGYQVHDTQWSQELRLKFPSMGPVDVVGGLYYFQQDLNMDQITDYGSDAAAWLSGIPNSLLPTYARLSPALAGLLAYNQTRWDVLANPSTRSYAAFGQAVWHVTPVWNITAGLRVTDERKYETVSRPAPVSVTTGAPAAALASQAVAPFSVGVQNTAPSYLISTDYHVAPSIMLYASISHGEKAGGVNPNVLGAGQTVNSLKVQPEQATDYEFGVKGDAFARRLSFTVDAFYTDVSDYQATFISTVNGSTVQLLTNVVKVRTEGFEAEATVRPVRGMTLSANGAYDDAFYVSYPDAPCPAGSAVSVCNLTGRPVAGAPRWTGNLDAEYERPVYHDLSLYGAAEFSYRSQFYGYLDDSPYSSTGDYGLLNLRLGVRSTAGHWDLSIWGKNVTDRRYVANYLSYGTLLPGAYVPFFADPATFGATLRASF
jgi:iron complex outermembrane receptor protein